MDEANHDISIHRSGQPADSRGLILSELPDLPQEMYSLLLEREKRPPLDTDVITVAKIPDTSDEFTHLKAVGATDHELVSGKIERLKLRAAGYVFVNRMHIPAKGQDMQKPLINAVIDGENYGKKILLTQNELDKVILRQQKSEITPEIRDEMRGDMISFLLEAKNGRPNLFYKMHGVFNNVLDTMNDSERENFKEFYERWKKSTILDVSTLSRYDRVGHARFAAYFLKQYCADISPWTESAPGSSYPEVRGVQLEMSSSRRNSLKSLFSPFLDSGFIFPEKSLDTGIESEKFTYRRLNLMVWHLAGRGLSEMGDSPGEATDQQYMTESEYYDLFFEEIPIEKRVAIRAEESNHQKIMSQLDQKQLIQLLKHRFLKIASEFTSVE